MGELKRSGPRSALPGEGILLLARVTGRSAEEMATDGRNVAGGLLALGSEAMALLRGYVSEDPTIREAAYRRWAELNAMLPAESSKKRARGPGPSEANRARLSATLTKLVDGLREAEQSMSTPVEAADDAESTRRDA